MSKIEWLHRPGTKPEAWNPVTGCRKVSEGCRNCYAETMANRFWGDRPFTAVQCHDDRLDAPLHWREPRTVFVNSMSDLFHEAVPDEFIDRVCAVMALAPRHTFICLTKRPERMRAYLACMTLGQSIASEPSAFRRVMAQMDQPTWLPANGRSYPRVPEKWPLPNVWLGVSIEDQATADQRIPVLLQTPAAVRFVSAEPLLGPVSLTHVHMAARNYFKDALRRSDLEPPGIPDAKLDWVIAGGESGPKARPCDLTNILSLVQQTRNAGVKCFVKQIGSRPTWDGKTPVSFMGQRIKSRNGGDPDEWIEELRVREWPQGGAR